MQRARNTRHLIVQTNLYEAFPEYPFSLASSENNQMGASLKGRPFNIAYGLDGLVIRRTFALDILWILDTSSQAVRAA